MTKNRLTGQAGDDVGVNVGALPAAIDEIDESGIHRTLGDPQHVSIDDRGLYTWRELTEAFELDVYDFSASKVSR